jgi:16S rRNA (uracil1498-N3)-methyltransferase
MPGHFTFYSHSQEGNTLILDETESKHLGQVLRYQIGDEIEVSNGRGSLFQARLLELGKKGARAEIISESRVEAPVPFVLAMGILKSSDKMEWVVEKATELGVPELVFLHAERCERNKVNDDRLYKAALSAVKQSHSAWMPNIRMAKFVDFVAEPFEGASHIAHCPDELGRPDQLDFSRTRIAVGPEGDFSDREVELALAAGFTALSMGKRVLRSETAALYAAVCYARGL